MGSCAAPSAKGDDKFITTDYLQQCRFYCFLRVCRVPQRTINLNP
ncbi:large terminase, partial [Klebsiella pneumoniae]|nr:large terminase [Klebsiella pneumoniae]